MAGPAILLLRGYRSEHQPAAVWGNEGYRGTKLGYPPLYFDLPVPVVVPVVEGMGYPNINAL